MQFSPFTGLDHIGSLPQPSCMNNSSSVYWTGSANPPLSSLTQPTLLRVSSSASSSAPWQYRLQLNALQITNENLPRHLTHAAQHVLDVYRTELLAATTSSSTSGTENHPSSSSSAAVTPLPPLSFADVPLVEVTFNHNHLTDEAMRDIIPFISANPSVSSFEILGNQLTDAVAPYLCQLIECCPNLRRLKLADNRLTDATALALGEKIFTESTSSSSCRATSNNNNKNNNSKKKKRFLQMNIGGNAISDAGVKLLCEAALASGMEILGLRAVNMGPQGWAACGAACAAYSHLELATPLNEPIPADDVAAAIGGCKTQAYGESTSALTAFAVTELQLKTNVMTYACMESFVRSTLQASEIQVKYATAFAESHALHVPPPFSTITSLSLSSCSIDATMCTRLVDAMHVMTFLDHVDLSHNDVGDLGCASIASWLASSSASRLTSLSLEVCQLTGESLKHLSDAFSMTPRTSSSSISVLDIGGNVFGLDATNVLTQLLSHTPHLEKLYVRCCHLGGQHLFGLVNALMQLPKLSDLDFTSNFSGDEGSHWQYLLASSPSLRRVLLTDNGMTTAATSAIADSVVHSPSTRLVVLQIGGKSKVEPVANVVSPNAHAAVLRAIQRNRQAANSNAENVHGSIVTSTISSHHSNATSSTVHSSVGPITGAYISPTAAATSAAAAKRRKSSFDSHAAMSSSSTLFQQQQHNHHQHAALPEIMELSNVMMYNTANLSASSMTSFPSLLETPLNSSLVGPSHPSPRDILIQQFQPQQQQQQQQTFLMVNDPLGTLQHHHSHPWIMTASGQQYHVCQQQPGTGGPLLHSYALNPAAAASPPFSATSSACNGAVYFSGGDVSSSPTPQAFPMSIFLPQQLSTTPAATTTAAYFVGHM